MAAYKTGDKSKFACFWDEETLKKFQQARGNNFEESDLKLSATAVNLTMFLSIADLVTLKNVQRKRTLSIALIAVSTHVKQ
jgi:hypothetical protein